MAFKKFKLIDDVIDKYQLSFKKENFLVKTAVPIKVRPKGWTKSDIK